MPVPPPSWPGRAVAACVELLSSVGTVCMAPALLWTRLERIVWQPPAWGGSRKAKYRG